MQGPTLLLFFSLLGASLAAGLWFAYSEPREELEAPVAAGTVEPRESELGRHASRTELPSAATVASEGRAQATDERTPVSAALATEQPPDGPWVEGRVIFPAGTPVDEVVRVLVNPRRSPGFPEDVAHASVEVAADGRFRFLFPDGADRATLELEARYLYLPTPVRVSLDSHEDRVRLEPELGGRIVGRVLLPTVHTPSADVLEGSRVHVTQGAPDDSWTGRVRVLSYGGSDAARSPHVGEGEVERDGSFVVERVPAGDGLSLRVHSDHFRPAGLDSLEARPGVTLEVEVSLRPGVRLAGRVVDKRGLGIRHAELRVHWAEGEHPPRTIDAELDGSAR